MTCRAAGIVIANKTDLRENNRDAISTKDAEDFCERNDFKYFEASAVSLIVSTAADTPCVDALILIAWYLDNVFIMLTLEQQQNTGIEAPFTYIAEWFYKKYQNAAQRA